MGQHETQHDAQARFTPDDIRNLAKCLTLRWVGILEPPYECDRSPKLVRQWATNAGKSWDDLAAFLKPAARCDCETLVNMDYLVLKQTDPAAGAGTATDERFGFCPICAFASGFFTVGRRHWFICIAHRTCWMIMANSFSEPREEWRRDVKQIEGEEHYRRVEPLRLHFHEMDYVEAVPAQTFSEASPI